MTLRRTIRRDLVHSAMAVLGTAQLSCSEFDGLHLSMSTTRAGNDASAICHHATVEAISGTSTIAAGDHEFTVAFRRLAFPLPDGGQEKVGFDLDGKCTGEGEGPSCREPSWAGYHPDGPDGRDNSVMSTLLADGGALDVQAKQAEFQSEGGLVTLILHVSRYNGTRVDNDVGVALYGATRSPDLLNQEPNPGQWLGNDVWNPLVEWISPVSTPDGGSSYDARNPLYVSSRAYVIDDVLVAHLNFGRTAPAFTFSDLWIQARLEDPAIGDGQWSLREGVWAGRLKIDDLLANAEFQYDESTDSPITCTDSPDYAQKKRTVCGAVDIAFSGYDASAACDAASWAFTFEAEPVKLSNEVNFTRASDFVKCPAGTSPSTDHCATLDVSP
jgi:hypothetical protein